MSEREIAIFAIEDILRENAYNNIHLRKTLNSHNELNRVQKAFVTQLVNGTLRNLIQIDYIIGQFSKTPIRKMKPLIINSLRIGVFQIMYMDKVPVSAACNEAVKIVKAHGFKNLSGFVNGILRNAARNKDNIPYPNENTAEYLSVRYSYPQWIIDYWLEDHDFETVRAMCKSNNETPEIALCVNTIKTNTSELKDILKKEGVAIKESSCNSDCLYISKISNITDLEAYKKGMFHIMDESALMAVKILSPKKGSSVIDVCAAPGGKSFACAYAMKNKGSIISGDIYDHKAKLIEEGAKRLGIDIITTKVEDARDIKGVKADYVIVDAPCSGLGLVRKKPDIKYNKSMEDIESLSNLQREILANCEKLVAPNGVLLYSTCTISHKENLDNVAWFCNEFGFEAEDISQYIPAVLKCPSLKKGYIEITPNLIGSDGFFIARLRRKQ